MEGVGAPEAGLLQGLPEPWVLLAPVRDDSGTITDFVYADANAAACKLEGLPAEEVIGTSLTALHPNVADTGLMERYRAVVQTGEPMALLDMGYPDERSGGRFRYFDIRAVRSGDDISQVWAEVTDRHEALALVTESEARYRLLAENASDVVFRGNNDGIIEWVSPQVERILGVKPGQVIGTPFAALVDPADLATVHDWQASIAQGRSATGTLRVRSASGDEHWVLIDARPVFDDTGHVSGRVGSWTQIDDIMKAREEADAQRTQTRAILDSQIDPFVLLEAVRDETGRIVDLVYADANEAAIAYNQTTREQLLGKRVLELYPGQIDNGPMREYFHCIETGAPVVLDDYFYPNEVLGQERRYDIRATRCDDGVACTWRDVTDRYRAVALLADSEQRYRLLAENVSDVVWQIDSNGRITWASESSMPVLGWRPESLIGEDALEFVHPDDRDDVELRRARAAAGTMARGEHRVRSKDGEHLWMDTATRFAQTTSGTAFIVAMHDITAEIDARSALREAIGRDQTTGLMSRGLVEHSIANESGPSGRRPVTVICIGMDALSMINNAYTHRVGDIVLTTIAARIVGECGDANRVGRGDGADFFVIVPNDSTGAAAQPIAERIRLAAKEPIKVGPHLIEPTVSIGIASAPMVTDPVELIRASTVAMRAAKAAGHDRIAFASPELSAEAEQRLTHTLLITDALRKGQVTCWYQPIVDLMDGQLHGYEALARWIKPDGSVVAPGMFIPLIEKSPLINELDHCVIACTLETLAVVPAPLFISVNISARALESDAEIDLLLAAIKASAIDAERIHLEVTETALFDSSDATAERMRKVAATGARWYVDDFGTGYSSISHLRDLPISGLKLDVSFTRGLATGDPHSVQLARGLAGLAQGLGLDTVAEGVETSEQSQTLSAQGWRRGQGWLYGKAEPIQIS